MRKKTFLLGICTILSSALLVSCKPALEQGDVSSDPFTASVIANVRPVDQLEIQAKVQEDSTVLVTWSTVSRAGSYTVSRSEGTDGEDWEILSTLTSDKTSYSDETAVPGKEYHYKVEAACEYSNTDRFAYDAEQMPEVLTGDCSIYTGVGAAYWSEEISQKEQITLGSITLAYSFGASGKEGVEPEGVEIYRGTSKGKYSLLERAAVKDFSGGDYDFGKNYVDKTVEQGKTYYYQVRAYAVINGKRIYGKKSTPLKLTAAEPEGKYSLRVAREPGSYSQNMIVALTSTAKRNGTLTLSVKDLETKISYQYQESQVSYDSQRQTQDPNLSEETYPQTPPVEACALKVTRISSDGRYYSSVTQDVILEPEKTVYLELEPTDSTQKLSASGSLSCADIFIPARYNEGKHTMKLDLKTGKAALLDVSSGDRFPVWKETTGKGNKTSLILGILSGFGDNHRLTLTQEDFTNNVYSYQLKEDEETNTSKLLVKKYSTDGIHWKKTGKKAIFLKAYGMLYLKLEPVDEDQKIPCGLKGQRHGDVTFTGTYGKSTPWEMTVNVLKLSKQK